MRITALMEGKKEELQMCWLFSIKNLDGERSIMSIGLKNLATSWRKPKTHDFAHLELAKWSISPLHLFSLVKVTTCLSWTILSLLSLPLPHTVFLSRHIFPPFHTKPLSHTLFITLTDRLPGRKTVFLKSCVFAIYFNDLHF